MTFPALVPPRPPQVYVPRIFGFKVYKGALAGEAPPASEEAAGAGGGGGGGVSAAAAAPAPAPAAAPAGKKDAVPALRSH